MISVAILGATGMVGQKLIQLLTDHPYFTITELVASKKSSGRAYKDACTWLQNTPIPSDIATMTVKELYSPLKSIPVFSGLDSSVAGDAETHYASMGHTVISNAKNHRMDTGVPLIIPEINPHHADLIATQDFLYQDANKKGCIITNPNCATIVASLALAPLYARFGLESVYITSMQAISGAGYPGVSSMEIIDNVIPYIADEEEKLESEAKKILGSLSKNNTDIIPAPFAMHALCTRVPVIDGHSLHIIVEFSSDSSNTISEEAIIDAWNTFTGTPQVQALPLAPTQPVLYFSQKNRPQPRLDRDRDKGMGICIGRLKPCRRKTEVLPKPSHSTKHYSFFALGHNTIRGAAGAAVLNAELLHHKRLLT